MSTILNDPSIVSAISALFFAVLTLATILLTKFVIPLVAAKAKEIEGRHQYEDSAAWAATFVRWAEQTIPDKSARYEEVAKLLSERCPYLTEGEIEASIEAAVHALKVEFASFPQPSVSNVVTTGDVVNTGDATVVSPAPGGAAPTPITP